MKNISFCDVQIAEGFWRNRQRLNTDVTIPAIAASYSATGRFGATKCAYRPYKFWQKAPHIFFDSDVAKWIEAAAYSLQKEHNDEFVKICDSLIANIASSQDTDGYYNAHFLVTRKDKRFSIRTEHELYCLGHLIEAAIAYHDATGKDVLLDVVEKYVDLVDRVFRVERTAKFATPGHPELELALIRLYEATAFDKYLTLARFMIDERGRVENSLDFPERNATEDQMKYSYAQDFAPVREQRSAEGHCVRACYLYSAMADLGRIDGDDKLLETCKALFDNIAQRRSYVTGGIGARADIEGFDQDFILPNDKAYTETCAAIALMQFAHRLFLSDGQSKYADMVERIMYNGMLSGVSLSGDQFFYENALEVDLDKRRGTSDRYPATTRKKDFSCSCCPPNLARTIAAIGDYIYSTSEETLYVHQYVSNEANIEINGTSAKILVNTAYPENGKVEIRVEGMAHKKLALRIPEWCTEYSVDIQGATSNGYFVIDVDKDVFEVAFNMQMSPVIRRPDERVATNKGTLYVTRGPVVYCMEAYDNGRPSVCEIAANGTIEEVAAPEYGVPRLIIGGYRLDEPRELVFIPYFAFANRGESNMLIYVKER